ncbi:MotA/TolQ/ExbB proton channel family protein [Ketogulonicigenium robustum]|uniref:MotA/TolQ/ExbB proton channel family protein n=1 Tax=Ketogulonicigenium robustum TaxID=92947 RepID=A0A1W6P0X7_9RHOB|nr:biopolymer transporter ExbB [Ketogulonicigenium robustum]ARO15162.1 MotA/TolQ/ExbB proton channel family protein [Ketogulonicigenium robustum]
MELNSAAAKSRFSQPLQQLLAMLVVVLLVAAGYWFVHTTIEGIFWTNPYLNGLIAAVFVVGVAACFLQVFALMRAISWIETFVRLPAGVPERTPLLLAPLAALLKSSRNQRLQLSPSSSRTILETVGQRIDEAREFSRYLANTLIFLGLLGTFYGLATAVPALVDTIRSLNPQGDETGAAIFARLQAGLETQLGGMGTAFSSSLLGLSASLIIGLLELFAGRGQNRFYNELEDWLSSFTRVTYSGATSGEDGTETSVLALVMGQLTDQLAKLQGQMTTSQEASETTAAQMQTIATSLSGLMGRMEGEATALARIAEGQDKLVTLLAQREGVADGFDPESRMRLRSIDGQMNRVIEELTASRQESIAELRGDIATLTRTLREVAS